MSRKELVFNNDDAAKKVIKLECERADLQSVVQWYDAFYFGDNYTVSYDGVTLNLDMHGKIL